jgi:SAM-dependent methyltransferase
MDRKAHWDAIYRLTQPTQVSWYQAEAVVSRSLIQRVAPDRTASIIDVGGGESILVDHLIAAGYVNLTVLDVSAEALRYARTRVHRPDVGVRWLEADVLTEPLPAAAFDAWHDRAVFHFLLDLSDRRRYVQQVRRAVRPEGHVIVATFAHDGPSRCSGLDVARYTPEHLHAEFGDDFELVAHESEEHITPFGTRQAFVYCLCRLHAPVLTGV